MNPISRNQPCPCGSGKRYKNCCGQEQVLAAPAGVPEAWALAAIPVDRDSGAPALSIILPWFRKLDDFRRVLPLNLPYFARAGIEVVLALDENSEEAALLALLDAHPQVRWTVIVNDAPHPWRPPCKAINVGLRHATGRYVFVASPESAFIGDVPAHALQVVRDHPDGVAIGRVGFARYVDLQDGRSLQAQFAASVPVEPLLHTFYGSVCAARAAFEAIRGYDESFVNGGGDDDNVRVRLEMSGCTLLACTDMRVLHLADGARDGSEHFDPEDDFTKCTPSSPTANSGAEWGRDFARVARRAVPRSAADTPPEHHDSPASCAQLRPGSVVPTGSRRRCEICGRLLHYDPALLACAGCRSAPATVGRAAGRPAPPRIACVMQLRNEERYLEGCFAHLRGHVDGLIALDDGSTDATPGLLAREPGLLDCIRNPASREHVWRERDNKRRLLQRARELDIEWVLCCDADERFERAFLQNLRTIAGSFPADQLVCIVVTLRELWDSPWQYRVDGVWGRKTRARFFRLPPVITFDDDQDLHGQWYPDQVRKSASMVRLRYVLYHLKTIRREDRERRQDFYNRIDPERRFQAEGYDYLAEDNDLRLETIAPDRGYDRGSLPPELRASP